jgi:hypothetical protein
MKVATKKMLMSVLVIGVSVGVSGAAYAQTGGTTAGENGTLVPGVNSAGTATPGAMPPSNDLRAAAGLSKGSDGIISSMRSNGTRTTESSVVRPPNRTGTVYRP